MKHKRLNRRKSRPRIARQSEQGRVPFHWLLAQIAQRIGAQQSGDLAYAQSDRQVTTAAIYQRASILCLYP